jgi:hypothetical protein
MNFGKARIHVLMGGLLAVAVVLVAVPAGVAAGGQSGPEATASRYCGKANIGFTSAKVRARNVACFKARRFVRRSSRRQITCNEANDFCRVTHYKGFRCVKSGRSIVKVRCQRGSQVISETHGD